MEKEEMGSYWQVPKLDSLVDSSWVDPKKKTIKASVAFSDLISKTMTEPNPSTEPTINPGLSKMVISTPEQILAVLNTDSEADLADKIKRSVGPLLERPLADLFTNKKFLNAFRMATEERKLEGLALCTANNVLYNTLVQGVDEATMSAILKLGSTLNVGTFQKLCAIGLPVNMANMLAIIRNASMDERINANNVICTMCLTYPSEYEFTPQVIADIVQGLFDNFSPVFNACVLGVFPENKADPDGMIRSTIYNVLLDLLEDQSHAVIYGVLMKYVEEVAATRAVSNFNVSSISSDHIRIRNVIEYDLKQMGIYL